MKDDPEKSSQELLAELKALTKKHNELFRLYNISLDDLKDLRELLDISIQKQKIKQMELEVAQKEIALQEREKKLREEATRELEAFSYSVSHDLRAPLRHIIGYIDLLVNRFHSQLPEKAKYYLDTIADSTRQMDLLINDLLEFSRTGRKEVQNSGVDMNGMVEEIINQLKPRYSGRELEWQVAKLPLVYCDEAMIYQVWQNLLDNAVKFTGTIKNAVIKIQAAENDNEYVFSVSDNGVGFDMKYAQNLFGIFQRLHSYNDFEGTGIGLANVRNIILKHKGLTWAEAEPNKGATFYFSLPKNK